MSDSSSAASLGSELRILFVEDQADDAELLVYELERAGFNLLAKRVEVEEDYRASFEQEPLPDIILADYTLPRFDALRALAILQELSLDIPFIVVTGSVGEERAVECMRRGATDYLLKDRLSRLGLAVSKAIEDKQQRNERREAAIALRKREEYFRMVLENAQDLVVVIEPDHTISFQSQSTESTLGYRLPSPLPSKAWDLIHPDDRGEAERAIQRIRDEGGADFLAVRVRHRDGSWRLIESVLTRLSDEESGRTVVNARDVTERAEAEEALAQSESQLRQAQKMDAIGMLAGGVAHDFNNILTVIGGYNELLLADDSDDPELVRTRLQAIRKATDSAASLTRQLLAFSRRQVMQPRVIDLNVTIDEMEQMLSRIIGEHIELVLSPSLDESRVVADPGQIEQVIMNLAVNARDAMPHGGQLSLKTETVHLGEQDLGADEGMAPGFFVRLTVRDSGCGISKEHLSRVFEPFYTTKERGRGMGLGLSTVYGIVKQSNGHINVASEPQAGTSVEVYLPLAQSQVSVTEAPAQATVGGEGRILIVEDDDAVRMLTAEVLSSLGYSVIQARDGEQALQQLSTEAADLDLMITDVIMPGMTGVELAKRVSETDPELKILFTSGYTDETIPVFEPSETLTHILQKPFTAQVLAQKVSELTSRRTS